MIQHAPPGLSHHDARQALTTPQYMYGGFGPQTTHQAPPSNQTVHQQAPFAYGIQAGQQPPFQNTTVPHHPNSTPLQASFPGQSAFHNTPIAQPPPQRNDVANLAPPPQFMTHHPPPVLRHPSQGHIPILGTFSVEASQGSPIAQAAPQQVQDLATFSQARDIGQLDTGGVNQARLESSERMRSMHELNRQTRPYDPRNRLRQTSSTTPPRPRRNVRGSSSTSQSNTGPTKANSLPQELKGYKLDYLLPALCDSTVYGCMMKVDFEVLPPTVRRHTTLSSH